MYVLAVIEHQIRRVRVLGVTNVLALDVPALDVPAGRPDVLAPDVLAS
ncbi:hypothetical protein [Actinomadura latina]|nr:hypothetical protein [Actinomadura latina]